MGRLIGEERRPASLLRGAGEIVAIVGAVLTAVMALLVIGIVGLYYAIPDHGLTQLPLDGLWTGLMPGLVLLAVGYALLRTSQTSKQS